MGQFAIVITGMGNHGCSREVKDGEPVLGCQRPDCVDCIAREVVRRLKRNGVIDLQGELIHWPEALDLLPEATISTVDDTAHLAAKYALVKPSGSSVIDDLVTGTRRGSF